ncbi:MAG: ATP-binding protein [Bacteroidota bacterium]
MYNRLSLKIAAWTAGLMYPVCIGLLVVLKVRWPWVVGAIFALLMGFVTYAVVYYTVAERLELARSTLRQIRKRRFDNLEATHVPKSPKSDELSVLVRQVYRTGLAMRREIDELKRMENYRREFLGNVSHELKTPIFAIQGFSETLLDGALEDPRVNRSFVDKTLTHAHRLNALVQDLTEISRLETGALKMQPKAFDIEDLVGEVTVELELQAQQNDVTLTYRMLPDLPPVLGDRDRIRQVLVNLCDNGVKYSEAGGTVEIVAAPVPSGEVKISVVDDGIGIAPEHLSRLTERFYRIDKSRSRRAGGTGLGLAIVKHILEAHGRKLSVQSRPGHGSIFSFSLDAAKK